MKELTFNEIKEAVGKAVIDANINLPENVHYALSTAAQNEHSVICREVYDVIEQNILCAKKLRQPLCQDTGTVVCFARIGQELHITGGLLTTAINEGVVWGYREGFLRKSIVTHPLERKNTGDNTPAVIHLDLVEGDALELTLLPKGGGAENMSALAMLPPAAGREGVLDFVLSTIKQAGANPCPPVFVGVGLGGNFEQVALLAKMALIREKNTEKLIDATLEQELLEKINALGIGAQGFGGDITALDVKVESRPCHIASLPVAVNINCHVARHITIRF